MKNDPPVIGGVLCSLETFEFGRVDEGASMYFVAFGTHAICYYNVLEAAFVADVVVLCSYLAADQCLEIMHIRSAS